MQGSAHRGADQHRHRDGTGATAADIDALMNHADLALYAAKTAGRGLFRFFTPQMASQTRRRLQIEQALRGALERGELSLAFQPMVDMHDWRITGFEALLRWHHAGTRRGGAGGVRAGGGRRRADRLDRPVGHRPGLQRRRRAGRAS